MTSASYVGATPTNVVQGPAEVYWGQFGVVSVASQTNTTVKTDPGSGGSTGFTDFGATTGGVNWDVDYTYGQIKADQVVDPIGARLTGRMITVTTSLLEATMQNLAEAMNDPAQSQIGVGSGINTFTPLSSTAAPGTSTPTITQPTYSVLIIDGWAPALTTGAVMRRRFVLNKVLNSVKATAKYDLTNQSVWACTFTCYYVSATVPPFYIYDQTS
jgi:hypothetical protein